MSWQIPRVKKNLWRLKHASRRFLVVTIQDISLSLRLPQYSGRGFFRILLTFFYVLSNTTLKWLFMGKTLFHSKTFDLSDFHGHFHEKHFWVSGLRLLHWFPTKPMFRPYCNEFSSGPFTRGETLVSSKILTLPQRGNSECFSFIHLPSNKAGKQQTLFSFFLISDCLCFIFVVDRPISRVFSPS